MDIFLKNKKDGKWSRTPPLMENSIFFFEPFPNCNDKFCLNNKGTLTNKVSTNINDFNIVCICPVSSKSKEKLNNSSLIYIIDAQGMYRGTNKSLHMLLSQLEGDKKKLKENLLLQIREHILEE